MNLAEAASGAPFDAVIIGGGINGCAIAEEASLRGLRVALLEQSDFGFGTTWRSTKLIHGGLRYLEHGDVRLVRESLRERSWLLKTRPYLVTPQRFILPTLPWSRRPEWQLRIGLATYDMLALYRGVPGHRHLSHRRINELAPYLPGDVPSGFSFFDARVHAPERLALELALNARDHGAFIANHATASRVLTNAGAVTGVSVSSSGETFDIPARAVVNAAGPWVDAVNEHGGLSDTELLGLTRGTHIVVELDEPPGRDAVFSTARSDGRVFFAVPQGELLLIGTTDERFEGDPGAIRPSAEDIGYLLDEARALMPGRDITRERIRYAYAGLRPLQKVAGGPEAAISRRHSVVRHERQGGPRGMYSLVGGKLSTFRPLAREVAHMLGATGHRDDQDRAVAPGWNHALRESPLTLHQKHHVRVYGASIASVLELGTVELCPHSGAIEGEVRHAARREEAHTLADLMLRRTGVSWGACRGRCCDEAVAAIAAAELGWNDADRRRELDAFRAELDFHLPTVDLVEQGTTP